MLEVAIEEWQPWNSSKSLLDAELNMLAGILHDTVHAGASVSFILPFSFDEAKAFWTDTVLPSVACKARRVLIARLQEEILGTVQLLLAMPPNQHHRSEISKLLVHPKAQRRGIARSLMIEVERVARAERRRTAISVHGIRSGRRNSAVRSRSDGGRPPGYKHYVQGVGSGSPV